MKLKDKIGGDVMLFVYWKAVKSVFPNYSDQTIITRYINDFGAPCEGCSTKSLINRIARMNQLWLEEQRTHE